MTKADVTNEDIMNMLGSFANDIAQRLDSVHDEMNQRFDAVHTEMNQRFDAVHTEMNQRFDAVHVTLNEHGREIAGIKSTLDDHGKRLRNLQTTVDTIAGNQEAHANDIAEIYAILERVEKKQDVTDRELKETKAKLEKLIVWAHQAGEKLELPLRV